MTYNLFTRYYWCLQVLRGIFWPMYACVEQSSIYCCYDSVFVCVQVHSHNLSVITYWVLSSLLTTYYLDLAYMLLVINRLVIVDTTAAPVLYIVGQ